MLCTFSKLNRKVGSPERNKNELIVEKCFSIIHGQERSIDLMIVDDNIVRDDVIKSIETLFDAYTAAKRFVSKDVLLLRSVWLECDKVSIMQFIIVVVSMSSLLLV
jgi:hypothetical protein